MQFFDQKNLEAMTNKKDSQVLEVPSLYYVEIRGIAQPIRNLFYYLDVKFMQFTVQNTKQLKQFEAGFNSGFPKLIQGEFQITDSITIFRHLCRYYDRIDLLGLTPQNKGVINQFLFVYSEYRSKILKKISEAAKIAHNKQSQGQIYQIKLSTLKCIVEQQCKIIKQFLQLFMKTKTWLLGYLTIIDFFFYEICFYIFNFFGSSIRNSLMYRNFQNFLILFQSQQFFIKNKQFIVGKKIFKPFKDKAAQEIMKSFWEGDKSILC